jgi:hypothetical protein
MKRVIFFACLCLVLSTFSCDKKDEITAPDQFPVWLQTKITELISDSNLCEYTNVEIIEYKGELYYNISCGLWNCIYCQIYDTNGNRPSWRNGGMQDFLTNKKLIKTLPACP